MYRRSIEAGKRLKTRSCSFVHIEIRVSYASYETRTSRSKVFVMIFNINQKPKILS